MRVILLLLCLFSISIAKLNIAVYDLKGHNTSKQYVEIITERLRTELVNMHAFQVMQRGEMDDILKELAFQQSGMCSENSCLAEIGQMLAVDRIISGSIGLIDTSFYTINLSLVNVETGEIVASIAHDFKGNIQELLSTGIKDAVMNIVSAMGIDLDSLSFVGEVAELYVESSLEGATIEIDDELMLQTTPALLNNVSAGKHTVVVKHGGFYGTEEVELKPNDLRRITISMEKGFGSIKVYSEPLGALIYIAGDYRGKTPQQIDSVLVGAHTIRLEKEGYSEVTEEVVFSADKQLTYEDTLIQLAYVLFDTIPDSALITVNGDTVETFLDKLSMVPGVYDIEISKNDHKGWGRQVEVNAGDTISLSPKLIYHYAKVEIEANDGAQIVFDGDIVDTSSWIDHRVPVGEHSLLITLEDHSDIKKELLLENGDIYTHTFTLEFTPEVLAQKKKRNQWIRRISFATASTLFAIIGYQANSEMEELRSVYDSYAGYELDKHSSNWSDVEKAQAKRNVFYSLSGACAIGFVISIPF